MLDKAELLIRAAEARKLVEQSLREVELSC
jgi:hypothetical protein